MRLTGLNDTIEAKRSVCVTDGPLLMMAYSRPRKFFRVAAVGVAYQFKDGKWVYARGSFWARGQVLKKDGMEGLKEHLRNNWFCAAEGLPHWAQEMVKALRPTGDPLLPEIYGNHEYQAADEA